jgi:hypothetical protein
MANVSYWSGSWVGDGFDPGVEHYWQWGLIDYAWVTSIMAQAVARLDREIMVKDVRTHVDEAGNRNVYLTIRNTGSNNIPGYTVNYATVSP